MRVQLLGEVPVDPSRGQARGWAVEELAGPEYEAERPGLVERIVTWVLDRLLDLPAPTGGTAGLVSVLVVLVALAVVAFAVHQFGGLRGEERRRRKAGSVLPDRRVSAADHRTAAEAAAEAGSWDRAVLERFRAVARTLEERAVLEVQPALTADEIARDAGAWLPELRVALDDAARLFDGVAYGDRPADAPTYRRLVELDDAVLVARPASTPADRGPRLALPS